jgi:hypothetical protein
MSFGNGFPTLKMVGCCDGKGVRGDTEEKGKDVSNDPRSAVTADPW